MIRLSGLVENRLQATSYKLQATSYRDQWRAAADCYSTGELCCVIRREMWLDHCVGNEQKVSTTVDLWQNEHRCEKKEHIWVSSVIAIGQLSKVEVVLSSQYGQQYQWGCCPNSDMWVWLRTNRGDHQHHIMLLKCWLRKSCWMGIFPVLRNGWIANGLTQKIST